MNKSFGVEFLFLKSIMVIKTNCYFLGKYFTSVRCPTSLLESYLSNFFFLAICLTHKIIGKISRYMVQIRFVCFSGLEKSLSSIEQLIFFTGKSFRICQRSVSKSCCCFLSFKKLCFKLHKTNAMGETRRL